MIDGTYVVSKEKCPSLMQKIFSLQSAILFYFEYLGRFKEIADDFFEWIVYAP